MGINFLLKYGKKTQHNIIDCLYYLKKYQTSKLVHQLICCKIQYR